MACRRRQRCAYRSRHHVPWSALASGGGSPDVPGLYQSLEALMIRYLCPRELLPMVEAVLAADGYKVEQPAANKINGDYLRVMSQQSAVVLLSEPAQSGEAVIEVFGAAASAAVELLE